MSLSVSKRVCFVAGVAAVCWLPLCGMAQSGTAKMVSAADRFLATLSAKQRAAVLYKFDDAEQRKRWSNFPTGFIPRGGISLKEMTLAQRKAAMVLLAAALSPRGFEKVTQIMEGDEVNKNDEIKMAASGKRTGPPMGGGPPPGGRPPNGQPGGGSPNGQAPNGQAPGGQASGGQASEGQGQGGPPPGANRGPMGGPETMFGKELYYISILGTPSETTPWMLQFGGHHLALNLTVAGPRGVLTPTLTGAQPALYTLAGKTVRPLGAESDKALALMNALDAGERKQAILGSKMADLVLGPGQDGVTIQPEGLKASGMTEPQRAMLLDLMAEWAGIIEAGSAATRMTELKADVNETWFAWSGPANALGGAAGPGKNIQAYYRIQGPHVVIEYAPQGLGGDPSNHVHTMYRDPTDDYGRRLVTQ